MVTERISYTSSAPTTEFSLYADRQSQSKSGNYTVVRIYIRAYNRGTSSSYSNYSGSQKATVDGFSGSLTHSDNPFLPSGVASNAQRWQEGPWDIHIPHKADGTRGAITLRMALNYGNGSTVLSRTASFNDFPDITVTGGDSTAIPDPPVANAITNISHTGMTFQFTDGDNNGLAITSRQYQVSTSSTFTGAPTVATSGSLIITRSDLIPGTTYYWRARTMNSKGYSNWSQTQSAKTYPGIFVKVAGTWKIAIPYVRVAGHWRPAIPYLKSSSAWKLGSS